MPFTVLKKSKVTEDQIEVAGEFAEESEAQEFAEESRMNDESDEHEYMIEAPPSVDM